MFVSCHTQRPVNFFGHVVVSNWYSSEPSVAFGSMLPDFASMCRGRLLGARDPQVADGIDLHHRTDRVFHTLEVFTDLEQDTTNRLQARGIGRGGAMATGHVGVELLLDGLLLDDSRACSLYLAALACEPACAAPTLSPLDWKQTAHAQQWAGLHQRLSAHGLPVGYRDPDTVASRLQLILRGRPTLALSDWEVARVAEELPGVRTRIAARLDELLDGLRHGLRDRLAATTLP